MFQQFGLRTVASVAVQLKINFLPAQTNCPDKVLKEEEQSRNSHLQNDEITALLIYGLSCTRLQTGAHHRTYGIENDPRHKDVVRDCRACLHHLIDQHVGIGECGSRCGSID